MTTSTTPTPPPSMTMTETPDPVVEPEAYSPPPTRKSVVKTAFKSFSAGYELPSNFLVGPLASGSVTYYTATGDYGITVKSTGATTEAFGKSGGAEKAFGNVKARKANRDGSRDKDGKFVIFESTLQSVDVIVESVGDDTVDVSGARGVFLDYGDGTATPTLNNGGEKSSRDTVFYIQGNYRGFDVASGMSLNALDARGGDDFIILSSKTANAHVDSDGKTSVVHAGDGDDIVFAYSAIAVDAGAGDDYVNTGAGDDYLGGGGGSDVLFGGAGDDVIHGDSSVSSSNGSGGTVTFTSADSSLHGGDRIFGGAGDDTVKGGGGSDKIDGGDGDDDLDGGTENDVVRGGDDDDVVKGGAGNDLLQGGEGDDSLSGGDGEDVLLDGRGIDVVEGGGGNDTLVATGSGSKADEDAKRYDTFDGGDGDDVFLFNARHMSLSSPRGVGDERLDEVTKVISGFESGSDLIQLLGFFGTAKQAKLAAALGDTDTDVQGFNVKAARMIALGDDGNTDDLDVLLSWKRPTDGENELSGKVHLVFEDTDASEVLITDFEFI